MNNKVSLRGNRNEDAIALTILQEIHENAKVTQRKLASEHHVALGSVNIILKRLMNKGYVKITEVHPKRFLYYVTPKGFNEKGRLMLSYINRSVMIYKDIKNHVEETIDEMIQGGCRSVILCGVEDGFDIAYLVVQEKGLQIFGVYDFRQEYVGKQKFNLLVGDAHTLKDVTHEKSCAVLVSNVSLEPIIRRQLNAVLKGNKKVYSIV